LGHNNGNSDNNSTAAAAITYSIRLLGMMSAVATLQCCLIASQVKDHWEMDLSELISSAEQFKEKGTEFFKVMFTQFSCQRGFCHVNCV